MGPAGACQFRIFRSHGVKFDGIDLFLFAPHVDIDSTDDDLKKLADNVRRRGLVIGTVVAPEGTSTTRHQVANVVLSVGP